MAELGLLAQLAVVPVTRGVVPDAESVARGGEELAADAGVGPGRRGRWLPSDGRRRVGVRRGSQWSQAGLTRILVARRVMRSVSERVQWFARGRRTDRGMRADDLEIVLGASDDEAADGEPVWILPARGGSQAVDGDWQDSEGSGSA